MSMSAAQSSHISALRSRHAEIDAALNQEIARPRPDQSLIARLKKAKLRLKDALATD